jgi:signal transduction histidine kinase
MPERLNVLWGLISLRRDEDGAEHFGVLWGMLDMRTRRPPARVVRGDDPYEQASHNAEQRVEALRAAAIFGCLGLGFGFVAYLADESFWRGVWSLTSVVLVALAAGQLLALSAERFRKGFLADEIERTRERVETQRALAGQHSRDLRELTASIAHEIRNPITAAKSLVQQMGEDPGASDNVEYASVALEELDRVERSVSHLLRFAREEDVSVVSMRMSEVIEGALGALQDRGDELGVILSREIDASGAMAGDPEKLRRVILNLVGNAVDALVEAKTADPHVEVVMGEDLAGGEVWVRVRDNGPGVPVAERSRIFSPFHSNKEDGTGLGLAISKKIVEAHGGTIEVGAAPGGGAEFLVALPKQLPS